MRHIPMFLMVCLMSILSACALSSSDLDGSRQLTSLTGSEIEELCEW